MYAVKKRQYDLNEFLKILYNETMESKDQNKWTQLKWLGSVIDQIEMACESLFDQGQAGQELKVIKEHFEKQKTDMDQMKNSLKSGDSKSVEIFMKKLKEFKDLGLMNDEEKRNVKPKILGGYRKIEQ